MTNQATRIVVKAAGELSTDVVPETLATTDDGDDQRVEQHVEGAKIALEVLEEAAAPKVDIRVYKPTINHNREWVLSELDLGQLFYTMVHSF